MQTTFRGANNFIVLNTNRALVIQHLKRYGVCTRAEISRAIGLTNASITKIVATLMELGVVSETKYTGDKGNHRSIGLCLNHDLYKVIAVKLSRRSYSVGVFDIGGIMYDNCTEQFTGDCAIKDITTGIKQWIRTYLSRHNNVVTIGIAVPGPYDNVEGKILLTTEMNDWVDFPFRKEFEEITKPPVFIEHDANAGALADWWFGTRSYTKQGTVIHFLVGEGVGAGVISDGSMITGSKGIAGEIGHISIDVNGERCACGNYGCLEMYCSSLAFIKHAKRRIAECGGNSALCCIHPLTEKDVFAAAQHGDELAIELVKCVGRYIGYGIVTLVNAYNPDTIIISNVMSAGGEILLKEAQETSRERLLPRIYDKLLITLSDFTIDPVLYGAAAVATDNFLKKPTDFLAL